MRKIGYNLILIFGLIIAFGINATVSANDKDTKRPKNTGILAVKTSPGSYPVLVDGVQVGMSGVGEDAIFYLTPGSHRVEILGPDGKSWAKDITTVKDRKNCICIKMIENIVKTPCPYNISLSGPDKAQDGDLITFAAQNNAAPTSVTNVGEGFSNPLKYIWTVTPAAAKITSGLGSESITVDTTGLGGQTVTATVEVVNGYYDETCRQRMNIPTFIEPIKTIPPPPATLFDNLVFRVFDDDKARLDQYAIALQNRPDAKGYVIIYQGTAKKPKPLDSAKMARRTLDYLVKVRFIDPSRLTVIQGGAREQTMGDLWIVPPGATEPVPTPR